MNPFHALPKIFGLLLLCASSAVLADSKIYKYRMPNGDILYTQERPARGKLEEVIRVASPPPAQVAQARRELAEDRAQANRLAALRNRSSDATGQQLVMQATQALNHAEHALRGGIEPLPGERIANVNGTTRLTPEYFDRLRELRRSIEVAQQRLDLALSNYEATRSPGAQAISSSGR